ncbi:hypothetical protein ACIBL3_44725 [Kribbella sp. NPDC050124]|uniref:hypothetical protein n=1 Tax=Kribbella sp. NPDC050124 TaxID=3364114 RepID=UPI003796ECA1
MPFIPHAGELMDDKGELADDDTIRRLVDVVDAIAAWTALHTAGGEHRQVAGCVTVLVR